MAMTSSEKITPPASPSTPADLQTLIGGGPTRRWWQRSTLWLGVAVLLYAWREGDANMRGVWLCTRNDALSNVAVMLAALGVFGTGRNWPDLVVAGVMAALAISGGWSVVRQARQELAHASKENQPQAL